MANESIDHNILVLHHCYSQVAIPPCGHCGPPVGTPFPPGLYSRCVQVWELPSSELALLESLAGCGASSVTGFAVGAVAVAAWVAASVSEVVQQLDRPVLPQLGDGDSVGAGRGGVDVREAGDDAVPA